jgi:nitrogen-specific signal transduction histidine kinase
MTTDKMIPSHHDPSKTEWTITSPLLMNVLNALPHMVFVLDEHKQTVLHNRQYQAFFKDEATSPPNALGKLFGELFDCRNSDSGKCGSTDSCQLCGAAKALVHCASMGEQTEECRIMITREARFQALDFRVTATPVKVGDRPYTLLSVLDISDEKRRQVLERVFFHDILNTAGAIKGILDFVLDAQDTESIAGLLDHLPTLTKRLIDEIQAQRNLMKAERGELEILPIDFTAEELLDQIKRTLDATEIAQQRIIQIDPASENPMIYADHTLLTRILHNMVKNALEASRPGDHILIGARQTPVNRARFIVHNPQMMPPEIQKQVFQRSFSTKGVNRGIGTYSMKLLGERYLLGEVGFRSDGQGTEFYVEIPVEDLREIHGNS